jgi:hypothetical protein
MMRCGCMGWVVCEGLMCGSPEPLSKGAMNGYQLSRSWFDLVDELTDGEDWDAAV